MSATGVLPKKKSSKKSSVVTKINDVKPGKYEKKVVNLPTSTLAWSYSPTTVGGFGLITSKSKRVKRVNWVRCRDVFQTSKSWKKGLFFAPTNIHHKRGSVVAFLKTIELKLKIKKGSKFYRTNNRRTIWIVPARFWTQNAVRKSFFSAALKSSGLFGTKQFGEKQTFEIVLSRSAYFKFSLPAVNYFLSGATLMRKNPGVIRWRGNWVNSFSSASLNGNVGSLTLAETILRRRGK